MLLLLCVLLGCMVFLGWTVSSLLFLVWISLSLFSLVRAREEKESHMYQIKQARPRGQTCLCRADRSRQGFEGNPRRTGRQSRRDKSSLSLSLLLSLPLSHSSARETN